MPRSGSTGSAAERLYRICRVAALPDLPLRARSATGDTELSACWNRSPDTVQIVLLASGPLQKLGVPPDQAAVRFGEEAKAPGSWAGRRLLWLGDDPAFELTYWCGTCPVTFERLKSSTSTLSIAELESRLGEGLDLIDQDVLARFSQLLPVDTYLPVLLRVQPRLVVPVGKSDYFAHEQVATWGIDSFWGLPESPHTPYYRTFQTAVRSDAHLYEFVVPMVPPNWNDRERVQNHADRLMDSSLPTVVALSTLDLSQPAMSNQSSDYYEHWALTHFVLDGHHKLEAAARVGRPLQLLALIARFELGHRRGLRPPPPPPCPGRGEQGSGLGPNNRYAAISAIMPMWGWRP